LAYTRYAEGYYRDPTTGKLTNHLTTVKLAVRAVRSLYAAVPVAEFGLDVARAVLGHSMAAMSEHYSREVDRALALKSVTKFG
jgi:hypothetical protein